ncbi:CopM family metallochaperone [Ensifer soli]|uniref:CopM family metallochaperone n=1 Tax=Ciceribacter sp. sgz301302 TaxID=3342379 RepID=UPI0035B9F11D
MAGHGAMDHAAMPGNTPAQGDTGPSSRAFAAANAAMHAAMDIAFTGNADIDFVRGMIAHHEGAIAMARIELEHGKDAEIRRLAQEIIAAQTGEIERMKAWLAKNGG